MEEHELNEPLSFFPKYNFLSFLEDTKDIHDETAQRRVERIRLGLSVKHTAEFRGGMVDSTTPLYVAQSKEALVTSTRLMTNNTATEHLPKPNADSENPQITYLQKALHKDLMLILVKTVILI